MGQKTKITAFITGITGQDGAYLAAFLREKGYVVHGLVRWDSYVDPLAGLQRLDDMGLLDDGIHLHDGDICDANNVASLIKEIAPDEIYNLAALSHVHVSFKTPASSLDINTKGLLNILDAVKLLGFENKTKIYQASSSEMFGKAPAPQNEQTPFHPASPYGVSKLAAYWMARTYRESYGMFVANGILFNHESPLRGQDFVTQKIVQAASEFEAGRVQPLLLGNLDASRDWGHAKDYVRGMWMMLGQQSADDYVLATGQAITVRQFVEEAFSFIGPTLEWRGSGADEAGFDKKTGRKIIAIDEKLFRQNEVHALLGDASKAREKLGWTPEFTLKDLIADMVNTQRGIKAAGDVSGDRSDDGEFSKQDERICLKVAG